MWLRPDGSSGASATTIPPTSDRGVRVGTTGSRISRDAGATWADLGEPVPVDFNAMLVTDRALLAVSAEHPPHLRRLPHPDAPPAP